MIRLLATSLSGSEHIVSGGVKDRQSYKWATLEEGRAHLNRIEWTDIRTVVAEKITSEGSMVITWSNGSVTEHRPSESDFKYLKGGPKAGKKISKSDQPDA